MYKLIVVDDEEVIREGLKQFIDWRSMGYLLVSCFEDGKDAIEYLQNNQVDVVLTDIDMVHVSGLELSKFIHENFPQIKTVIVSGFKDFEFAKKAIEFNVEHYLTKPTDIKEINSVFQKMKGELDQKKQRDEEEKCYRQRYDEMIPLLKEQFLINVLSGAIKNDIELTARLETIKLTSDLASGNCCIIEVTVNTEEKSKGLGNDYIWTTLQKFFHSEKNGTQYISTYLNRKTLKILALSHRNEKKDFIALIDSDIMKIKKSIQKNFGIFLTFVKNPMFDSLIELAQNVKLNTSSSFQTGNDSKSALEVGEYRDLIQEYRQFISFIIDGNVKAIEDSLYHIFSKLEAFPIEDVQRLIIDLLSMISHTFAEMGVNVFEISKGKIAYQGVLNINNLEDIKGWCQEYLQQMINYYSKMRKKSSSHQIIEQAKKYIQHMYNKDLSLEDVADYVYLNHVYFSRLFKQQTGKNFSDYLTSIRIEKAIELLKENKYKTYEISEKVGYKSSKYFSRVFKQSTGCSPKEYCRTFLSESRMFNE
ncbi:response regulator [Halalkalibacter sp. APA_J-10(15)]|uniref:response regulator transcription factor n=1 Tax=Halalkalibacter sp. APA_J-10(15) TaxID=2933805 RepID=UPI001FF49C0B|nr:response regulator [Halalkalibacter sp. APA_J-10(15)]MCK0473674.1 response regulator [Halalkalibacter sp. APA_J-10(15)]